MSGQQDLAQNQGLAPNLVAAASLMEDAFNLCHGTGNPRSASIQEHGIDVEVTNLDGASTLHHKAIQVVVKEGEEVLFNGTLNKPLIAGLTLKAQDVEILAGTQAGNLLDIKTLQSKFPAPLM